MNAQSAHGKPRGYRASILLNSGHDSDYPPAQFPWLVFIRDLDNPLGSSWAFHRSQREAESFLAECRQHFIPAERRTFPGSQLPCPLDGDPGQ